MSEIKAGYQRLSEGADRFFHSGAYLAFVTAAGVLGFYFKLEIYTIYVIAVIAAAEWIFCKDLSPCFIMMFIISMTPLARYGEAGYFAPLYYIPLILGPAFIIRLFLIRPRIKTGRFFVPTLAVAFAVTLGGLTYLSAKEYFSMPGLYYVAGLGFGMVIINVILETNTPEHREGNARFFAKMMTAVGVMGIAMIITHYVKYFSLIDDPGEFIHKLQWGNNLSNCLLLSMPFSFYLAVKGKHALLHFALGVLQFFAMVLSFSRGGILFGTLIFIISSVSAIVLVKKKKDKIMFIAALLIMLAAAAAAFISLAKPLAKNLTGSLSVSGEEARVKLYKFAFENFLKYPMFGTGLQYNPRLYYNPQPMCIYWYHSTIFQILGSLGSVGLLAYAVQFFYRAGALLKKKTLFNLFTAFSVLGFAAYSMVNVGYFVPFPYMAALIQIFILVDRHNQSVKDPALMAEEKI